MNNLLNIRPHLIWPCLLLSLVPFSAHAGDFEKGTTAYKNKNYQRALKLLKPLAEDGNRYAQENLGKMYVYGEGVDKNYVKAVFWFKKSANQGLARAQFNLAMMYSQGKGVAKDYDIAANWFKKAKQQGHQRARTKLGVMYKYGKGVKKNYAEAAILLKESAEQGHAEAQYQLGNIFVNYGEEDKAVYWYRKAADSNYSWAQVSLAEAYLMGYGVPRNKKKAIMWMRRSDALGNRIATKMLVKYSQK